ncbi:XRE family transcriptional regulator [Macrococcoides goetzii]|nr:helix-turn-helix transcriptional regulator [Macrococcus goetzii]TDM47783.1 XRE family transcriptional regulator [Macrococcus goetzii]
MIKFNVNRLRAERIARGISLHDMAGKMEMAPSTYSKKETGLIRINVDDLAKAVSILDISDAELGIFFVKDVAKQET